jgi:hypothetical protein
MHRPAQDGAWMSTGARRRVEAPVGNHGGSDINNRQEHESHQLPSGTGC